jgi:HD-like signal output (HDOD) protein
MSRAIVILGFDTIRNLALTLLLFEHMHNRSHAQEVRDVATSALFCGLLARSLARQPHARSRRSTDMRHVPATG